MPSSQQTPSSSNEADEKVTSRFALTDKKREDRNRWEKEQREELSAKYKEERMRKKKVRMLSWFLSRLRSKCETIGVTISGDGDGGGVNISG